MSRGTFVGLVHLRQDSLRVTVGDRITVGDQIANCGNSGNSTQPHVHLQAMDSADLRVARGVPITFRDYREWLGNEQHHEGMPNEHAVVEKM